MVLLRTFHLDYCSENLQKTTHLNKKNIPVGPSTRSPRGSLAPGGSQSYRER